MNRGATCESIFIFPENVDFEKIEKIELILKGNISSVFIKKSSDEIEMREGNKISVFFSQQETLQFADNEDIRLQWHWRNIDGSAYTSTIIWANAYEFLSNEEI